MNRSRRADARSGVAAMEFALLAPVLLVLIVTLSDLVGYIRTWMRLERAANEVANIATQYDTLTASDISGLFNVANAVANPSLAWSSDSEGAARTIISVVSGTGTGNVVSWTCSRGSGGSATANLIAGVPSLPSGYVVPVGETVLVVEIINASVAVTATSGSILDITLPPVRTYAILRPRIRPLNSIAGCPT